MTDEATGSTGQPELTAIEAEKNQTALENSPPARPIYADVTAPGERRPVLPHWARSRDAAKHHSKRVAGAAAHTAAYHGVRPRGASTVPHISGATTCQSAQRPACRVRRVSLASRPPCFGQ